MTATDKDIAELDRLHNALKRARELNEHRIGDAIRAEIVTRRRMTKAAHKSA